MPGTPAALLAAFSLAAALGAQAHWVHVYPAQSPPPREMHAMAFHGYNGQVVLFGGRSNGTGRLGDHWEFTGATWLSRQGVLPPAREQHAMVYDAARDRIVLFGGSGAAGPLADTWEFNGVSWAQRSVSQSPPPREFHMMAYDRARRRTVLFGGTDSGELGDTWEWDGSAWQQRVGSPSPMPRMAGGLAWDPAGGGCILFGGTSQNQLLFDTWRWDGTGWQELQPSSSPFARAFCGAVTDVARGRIVVVGGTPLDPYAWEWDGEDWEIRLMASPSPRYLLGLAYDDLHGSVVLFSGSVSSYQPFADTWVYRTDALATFATIGAGCAGTAGTPELGNASYSLPWLGDTFTTRVATVPANGALLFATGFDLPAPLSLAPYGMPGCDLAVQIAETRLAFATAAGSADWSLAIPNSAGLAGVAIAQQVLVLDPGANAAGAVVSSAGRFTIGIR